MNKNYGPTLRISQEIDEQKYRQTGEDFYGKVVRISAALMDTPDHFEALKDILRNMRFLPAGRIQTAIGAARQTTAYNCFVSGKIEDSMESIMARATEAAETMRRGGGIGYDFSNIRPQGDRIKSLDSKASGPVSYMGIYDAICQTISSAGHRRGAQMGVLRIDHPDIERFITAKNNNTSLTGFNLSIGVTDEFMECLEEKRPFPLRFGGKVYQEIDPEALWDMIMRSTWDWAEPGVMFLDTINRMNNLRYCEEISATNPCFTGDTCVWTAKGRVPFAELAAKGDDVEVLTQTEDGRLLFKTMRNPRMTRKAQPLVKVTFDNGAEVRCTPDHNFFLKDGRKVEAQYLSVDDRIEGGYRSNRVVSVEPLQEVEDVYCGTVDETSRFFIALGIGGGALVSNCGEQPLPEHGACLLGSFNLTKYVVDGRFDLHQFISDIHVVTRAMDNVIDRTIYPLPEQEQEAKSKRRMGLGVTGLANAAEMCGHPYASEAFMEFTEGVLIALRDTAYLASVCLAKEKGSFPLYAKEQYLESAFVRTLPDWLKDDIKEYGIRNSHLLSLAPTGTISLIADNISSGIEPPFSLQYDRDIFMEEGLVKERIMDYAWARGVKGRTANEITAQEHLAVLALCSRYVDSAVSKTCNVGPDVPYTDFRNLYLDAWRMGCKGVTTFRASGKRYGIMTEVKDEAATACFYDPETGKKTCE